MALIEDFKISGLKCDTEHCNYRNDAITFDEYPNYLNSKCPICNNVLLTQKDYNRCLSMYKGVNTLNKISNVLKWINPRHYWRLIFGDKRKIESVEREFPKRSNELR